MAEISKLFEEIVTANRILAHEGIVDGYGHVSVRHPERPDRFFMSCARTPQCIEVEDILEYSLDSAPIHPRGKSSYRERFIHGALYEARPDVGAVVHSHSHSVIPFGVGGERIRPMSSAYALIGAEVPIWDAREHFGDTDLLVSDAKMGRDLARVLGAGSCALMRGHGSVVAEASLRRTVYISIALQESAELQLKTARYDNVVFLSPGEVAKSIAMNSITQPRQGLDRTWEYYCYRAGTPYRSGA
jgi:ribulose-5-phosphate 4-epimerase/fuculose-1-phosphate aldolase